VTRIAHARSMELNDDFLTGVYYESGAAVLHLVPTTDTTNSALCGSRVRVLRRPSAKAGDRCPECQGCVSPSPALAG